MRILFLAYSHFGFTRGGEQLMAQELMRAAVAAGHVAHMIAAPEPWEGETFALGGAALMPDPIDPTLSYFRVGDYDADLLSGADPRAYAELRAFIGAFRPDVVHFHHMARLGVEALVAARLAAPTARLTLTLHEMVAICPANGQMVKAQSGEICSSASPEACAVCEPGRTAKYLARRAARLKAAMSVCDAFVFPSRFLAQLYVGWGLDARRCAVIPNGVAAPGGGGRSALSPGLDRFAFFGQLIDNKGVDVALAALANLARAGRGPATGIEFQLHGANRDYATPDFRARVEALTREIERASAGRIRVVDKGAYGRDELAERMAGCDWVVVPSVWGEAFALVVSEAWMFGRPVLASSLGALRERVRHGVDGLLFPSRDVRALADLIAAACGDSALSRRLVEGIVAPPTPEAMLATHLRLWGALVNRGSSSRSN